MGKILEMRTPTGGRSSIGARVTPTGGIELVFERHLGDGVVSAETIVAMTARHAGVLAEEIRRLRRGLGFDD